MHAGCRWASNRESAGLKYELANDLVEIWMRRYEQYAVVVAPIGHSCSLRWRPDIDESKA